jgi:hypothetical protein
MIFSPTISTMVWSSGPLPAKAIFVPSNKCTKHLHCK